MIKKIILIVLGSLLAVVAVVVILFYVKGPLVGFPGSRTADGSRAVSDGGVKIAGWNGEVDHPIPIPIGESPIGRLA